MMITRVGRQLVFGAVLLGPLALGSAAHAAGTAASCAAAKELAAGKRAAGELKCYAKATKKLVTVDAACLAKADDKFTLAFTKTEAKGGCATTGDAPSTGSNIDACVTAVVLKESAGSAGCPVGQTTSVSGTVYAPNGTLPLPNALVYVPDGPVGSLPAGVTCDRCGSVLGATPLVQTVSDATGHFMLPGVPAGANVPLVIQIGKWRRQVLLADVPGCVDTPIPADQTRLPKNRTEGDIPLMAVSTGGADAVECLLRKLGIDDSEFTTPPGLGRIHLFAGTGGTDQFDAGVDGGRPFAASTMLWNSLGSLEPYDVVLLSCEGAQNSGTKPASSLQAMKDYADSGGRVYLEHWHNYWLNSGPSPWPSIVTFNFLLDLGSITADVDTTPGHAATFADWLLEVNASTTRGKIDLVGTKHTATAVDTSVAERLIYKNVTSNGQPTVQYTSFTTPVEQPAANRCGRVVFSDIHASLGDTSANTLTFPSGGCLTSVATLSPQEEVLAFTVFDISSCVDTGAP